MTQNVFKITKNNLLQFAFSCDVLIKFYLQFFLITPKYARNEF